MCAPFVQHRVHTQINNLNAETQNYRHTYFAGQSGPSANAHAHANAQLKTEAQKRKQINTILLGPSGPSAKGTNGYTPIDVHMQMHS